MNAIKKVLLLHKTAYLEQPIVAIVAYMIHS